MSVEMLSDFINPKMTILASFVRKEDLWREFTCQSPHHHLQGCFSTSLHTPPPIDKDRIRYVKLETLILNFDNKP